LAAQGDTIEAGVGRLKDIAGPAHAEAEASNQAVQLAAAWGISKPVLEANSTSFLN
jgi:hypothetical protein